ncbi:MAG TPA: PAS domain-containing sensor histidine kinase [Ilumatobacteraceae bacterium]|jgi:PAS domain S-box-containing protein|nr:PAS domain-containing sensor histidine kinase [Ilumatobacteraceae bacterium]
MPDAALNPWVLFESIPEMVVVVDTDGLIRYANDHCSEIVGWTSQELMGQPIETLIPTRLHRGHTAHRKGYTDDPRARPMGSGLLLTALHRSGREVPVEIALSPLRGELGEVAATVATVRDVSERLETAARLVEATTRLEVLDDRDRIARELHDSVIQRLFAAGLHLQASANRPDIRERVSEVVDEIDEAIREIRGVIFTLHRPAQLDSGLEAALRASINEAARLLGHRPTLRLGGILGNIPPELGSQLLAVLREALMNVAKHAEATRTEVSLDVAAESVILVVIDDGVGITETHSGGLGLRNIRERASKLGGNVEFSDVEPHGTQVRWVVPRFAE